MMFLENSFGVFICDDGVFDGLVLRIDLGVVLLLVFVVILVGIEGDLGNILVC